MSDSETGEGLATYYLIINGGAFLISALSTTYLLFYRKDIIANSNPISAVDTINSSNDQDADKIKNKKQLVNLSIGAALSTTLVYAITGFLFLTILITGTDEYYDISPLRSLSMIFLIVSKYCTWYLLLIRLKNAFKPSIFKITPNVSKVLKYSLLLLPVILVVCWTLYVVTGNYAFLPLSVGVLFIFDLFFTAYIQGRFLINLNKILKLTSESKPIFISSGDNNISEDPNKNYSSISDEERNEYILLVTKFAVLTFTIALASLSIILSIVFVGIFGSSASGGALPAEIQTCVVFDSFCNIIAIILYFSVADKLYKSICCFCHSSLTICCDKINK